MPEEGPIKPRITQRDIALAARVSNAAVSLALRESPSIPLATRQHIKQVALKLGYVPDPMLASLAAYRMRQRPSAYKCNIAWINGWPDPDVMHRPDWDFSDYYIGAQERAKEFGYNIEEIRLKDIAFKPKRLEKILLSKGITGLLLPPSFRAGGRLVIDFSHFSAVRFGMSYQYPLLHTVMNAQYRTALNTFQIVSARGYQRVGIILDKDLDSRTSLNFLGGFLAGQSVIEKECRVAPFYPVSASAGELAGWIRKNRIDAVIGLGRWPILQKAAVKVGYADMALVRSEKQISGMYQNSRRIGIAAVDFLVGMMRSNQTGIPDEATEILIKSQWLPGRTLPKVN